MNNHVLSFSTVAPAESPTATPKKGSEIQGNQGFSHSLREAEASVHEPQRKDKPFSQQHRDKNMREKAVAEPSQNTHTATPSSSDIDGEGVYSESEVELPIGSDQLTPNNLEISEFVDQLASLIGEHNLSNDIQNALASVIEQLQQIINQGGVGSLTSAIDTETLSEFLHNIINIDETLPLNAMVNLPNNVLEEHLSTRHYLSDLMKSFAPQIDSTSSKITVNSNIQQGVSGQFNIGVQGANIRGLPDVTSSATESSLTNGLLNRALLTEKLTTQMSGLTALDGQHLESDLFKQQLTADAPLISTSTQQALPPGTKAQLSVMIPFQQTSQWGQALGEHVVWMNSQDIQEAEIHLDPPELGPIQVKVSMVNDQAHVSFAVQHATVREALDQNAMRLRELFDNEGIHLVDVDVSDQSQQKNSDSSQGGRHTISTADSEEITESETMLSLTGNGYSLVNTYV